ncbi:hypothetical protein [Flexivirga meconopsidis]|uniref:iron-sulfur cluster-binding protein n=1 Tax=Flexivirga meconopsidis TaxID=2977121 RepID=UPI0022404501
MTVVEARGELIASRRMGVFQHHTIVVPELADRARPGQLASFAVGGRTSALLGRRTLPLAAITPSGTYGGTIEVVVDPVRDAGMRWLADLRVHDEVDVIGPLGRAFPLPAHGVDSMVLGVGASAAPLGWLSTALRDRGCRVELMLAGETDRHLVGVIEARRVIGTVSVVTPGPTGLLPVLRDELQRTLRATEISVVYAAARAPELSAVAEVARPFGVTVQALLDEAMPCGTGLCGSCEVPVTGSDGISRTIRCCTEGAVIRGDLVEWDRYVAELWETVR